MNDKTKTDEIIERWKNHPLISKVIFLGILIVAIGSVIAGGKSIIEAIIPDGPAIELVSMRMTEDFEIDMTLRNPSEEPIVIHTITLTIVKDIDIFLPIIEPSATYQITTNDLQEGESRSISVSHLLKPHDAERILIATHDIRYMTIGIELEYNEGQSVNFSLDTGEEVEKGLTHIKKRPIDLVMNSTIEFSVLSKEEGYKLGIGKNELTAFNRNIPIVNAMRRGAIRSLIESGKDDVSIEDYIEEFSEIALDGGRANNIEEIESIVSIHNKIVRKIN
jgi:hypothetical protein